MVLRGAEGKGEKGEGREKVGKERRDYYRVKGKQGRNEGKRKIDGRGDNKEKEERVGERKMEENWRVKVQ